MSTAVAAAHTWFQGLASGFVAPGIRMTGQAVFRFVWHWSRRDSEQGLDLVAVIPLSAIETRQGGQGCQREDREQPRLSGGGRQGRVSWTRSAGCTVVLPSAAVTTSTGTPSPRR